LNDLKESRQTAPRFMTHKLDRNQCIHGCPQIFFQERGTSNFAYHFQVADQNRRQNIFSRGAMRFCRGLDTLKIDEN